VILGEPQRTQFDLNFQLLGIPVRVSPFFWLMTLILGGDLAGKPTFLLLWIFVIFISILLHEFGHALAFRYFGIHSHVVLYHLGGLAVPGDDSSSFRTGRSLDSRSHIIVSAAGPGVQLLLSAIIILLVQVAGHAVRLPLPFLEEWLPVHGGDPIPVMSLQFLVHSLLYVNIMWALLNLMPIYPLDGGQIARELFLLYGGGEGIKHSLVLSVLTGAGLAIYGLSSGHTFLAIMFGMLAYSSYTTLQAYTGRGGGFGGGRPW
jgi:Zn-dependent protease